MPNHVLTQLTITGPATDIKRFVETVDGGENNRIDFNKLVPMPEEIRHTTCPTRIVTQEEIDKAVAEFNAKPDDVKAQFNNKPWMPGITQEQYDALIAKYRVSDWYEWANINWGTKWGAYDTSDWQIADDKASVFFNTAWCPGQEFFCQASELFPTLVFHTDFADEGGGFIGYETYHHGGVEDEGDFEWESAEAQELKEKLGFPQDED